MFRKTFAKIDLDAWAHNLTLLNDFFADAPLLCPMIKANGYGHGDIELARVIDDLKIGSMGVCLLEEGLRLRQAGIQSEILVFRSFDRAGAQALLDAKLTPVVSDWEQIRALEAVPGGSVNLHLKFDTGMNRLGFDISQAKELFAYFSARPRFQVKALLTHLFNGEDAASKEGHSAKQLHALLEAEAVFSGMDVYLHALNSAGAVAKMKVSAAKDQSHILMQRNWGARPGIMTYGYNPLELEHPLSLKPVMSLRTEVCAIRHLKVGETVSYSGTFTAQRPTTIAVVPTGYADGYHRLLSNRASAIIRGQRVPLVGNVCMDYMMFDVTDVLKDSGNKSSASESFLHEEVLLFGANDQGQKLSADELGKSAQTIPYEILTSISSRVPRVFSSSSGRQGSLI